MGSTIKKGTTGLWRLDYSTVLWRLGGRGSSVLWRLGERVFSIMEAGERRLLHYKCDVLETD